MSFNYWLGKSQRAQKAKEHTEFMKNNCPNLINASINDTRLYDDRNFADEFDKKIERKDVLPEIVFENTDTVSAILSFNKDIRIAALNFASYKNPGGMFLEGSSAQEECLCHSSYLYNVLSAIPKYYEWNGENKNKALYTNRALYSPNILFNDNERQKFCDVITCAAPNFTAAHKYCNVGKEENNKALESRIKFVLDIAERENIKFLILGAFGCGVFGQNPFEVAELFKTHLKGRNFEKVVFAVPGNDINAEAFMETFF